MPHKWTFYFLMAVGFWNFVGAGIFGFLINLPIVSYFEVGTILTPNHGHAALMGAFGMEAMALTVMAFRQVLPDEEWARPEKYIRVSFWGLNIGLALMVVGNLFPGGVLQFYDVLTNGYWHARSLEYLHRAKFRAPHRMVPPARRSGLHLSGGGAHGDGRFVDLSVFGTEADGAGPMTQAEWRIDHLKGKRIA